MTRRANFFFGCCWPLRVCGKVQKKLILFSFLLALLGMWKGGCPEVVDFVVAVVVVNVAQKLACSSCETFFICRY